MVAEIGFDSGELLESRQFTDEIQRALAEHAAEEQPTRDVEGLTAILEDHGVDTQAVHPEAAPSAPSLNLLTDDDWRAVQESEHPFLEIWSKANRRSVQERYESRYGEPRPDDQLTPTEQFARMESETLLEVLPIVRSSTAEALGQAIEHGAFLSNRKVAEVAGQTNGWGNTTDEDRELGLDQYVFFDYGRPRSDRLDDSQAEVIAVLAPQAMDKPGAFVTERDYLDILDNGKYEPWRYVSGLVTPEDLQAIVSQRIPLSASRSGRQQNGVFINDRLTVSSWLAGEDGDWDQYDRRPDFSTWEVKVPDEVSTDGVRRLIFWNESARDKFVAEHGDRYECIVVPDIKAAMARGEDVFGTRAVYRERLEARIHQDFLARKAVIDAAPAESRTISYCRIGREDMAEYDPAWLNANMHETEDEIVGQERALHQTARALDSLFADESDEQTVQGPAPTLVAKVVTVGNAAVIESITRHEHRQ